MPIFLDFCMKGYRIVLPLLLAAYFLFILDTFLLSQSHLSAFTSSIPSFSPSHSAFSEALRFTVFACSRKGLLSLSISTFFFPSRRATNCSRDLFISSPLIPHSLALHSVIFSLRSKCTGRHLLHIKLTLILDLYINYYRARD